MNDLDNIKIDISEAPKPLPQDVYEVKVTNIIKQEPRINPFTQAEETRLKFEFMVTAGKEKGKRVFASVTPKLSTDPKPSNLYKIWSACEVRNPKPTEFNQLHLSKLIGKTLKVLVNQVEKNDRIFNNIESYIRIEKDGSEESNKEEKEDTKSADELAEEIFN